MRASELIGAEVVDAAGLAIGKVHDLRVRRVDSADVVAPYEVTHLLVAGGSVATRLGYGRGRMHGPWPLSAVLERLMSSGYAVEWRQVASVSPRSVVRLSVSRSELAPLEAVLES